MDVPGVPGPVPALETQRLTEQGFPALEEPPHLVGT